MAVLSDPEVHRILAVWQVGRPVDVAVEGVYRVPKASDFVDRKVGMGGPGIAWVMG